MHPDNSTFPLPDTDIPLGVHEGALSGSLTLSLSQRVVYEKFH